jgi:hypothetical protein
MDVRLLVCSHPTNLCEVSVFAVDDAKAWGKLYPTKQECFTELYLLGLLTTKAARDMSKGRFEEDKIFIVDTSAEPDLLDLVKFSEIVAEQLR